ncbi:uncharacterized protein [Halyomorpha halys]|uniref:uncharacterized protein n=1 Tax=Halyomorpha halys TaxID=286706 RepID=UPI0006D4D37F|nr:uncharacterized protein LOC106679184 [Halyomorpha halys]
MLLWTLLCSCLFLGASAYEPDTFQVLVDLFNGLFLDSALSFEYEFGSGVSLLQEKATVSLQTPLQLLPKSTVTYPDKYTQLNSLELLVLRNITISQENRPKVDLVLSGCHIELDVAVWNKSDWRIQPIFVWLDDCETIQFSDGTKPPFPEQVLPTLSQGLLNTAVELFTKEYDEAEDIKTEPSKNFQILQDVFPVLMYLKGRPIVAQVEDED